VFILKLENFLENYRAISPPLLTLKRGEREGR